MTPATVFHGQNVAVFGLGGSGRATALALAEGGATVSAWDDDPDARDAARDAGVPVVDLRAADWESFSALVLAPGVPLTHPEPAWPVVNARAAGIEIIGDIEIFCRERRAHAADAPLVAITGTNGKSTTAALIAHIIAASGREVELGGNIGPPVLSLEPPRIGRVHVVECSSFQIDLSPTIDPTVGVLLNLTADHLDRHGSMAAYARIKERLVAASETAVIGVDDPLCVAIADRVARGKPHVVRVSAKRLLNDGFYAKGQEIYSVAHGRARRIAGLAGIDTLRGAHNAQNAVAAIAAADAVGLDEPEIVKALTTFPGLAHRLEEVGRRGGVIFINDSKATNADAAGKALGTFERIYWIVGGRAKAGGIASLKPFFKRVARAYLIGESAGDFADTLEDHVRYVMCGTLQAAVAAAAADSAEDRVGKAVVLLSPACASYDQFDNFEQRGDQFRALVRALNGVTSQGEAA